MAKARNRYSDNVIGTATVRKLKKAGHRSWLARGQAATGGHSGDIMSPERRSALMARIRGKDTSPEREIGARLVALGFKFECHPKDIPGRPDILFRRAKVAIFIDGDFWHGWRFPLWKKKLSEKWACKIESNRARDRRNFRLLRQLGWAVVRIWEHQVEQNSSKCMGRMIRVLETAGVLPKRAHLAKKNIKPGKCAQDV
jgi:DNA mismatch endonuclease (patch repair protein)